MEGEHFCFRGPDIKTLLNFVVQLKESEVYVFQCFLILVYGILIYLLKKLSFVISWHV